MRKALEIVGIFFVVGLASVPFILAADFHHATEEENIREVVFRHQFEHNASGLQQRAHSYCLEIGENGTDPSEQFMKSFAHHKPRVRKGSDCHWERVKVVDRTGKSSIIFHIWGIQWISDSEATVSGGYEEGNVSASIDTYRVKKIDGMWKVLDGGIEVISGEYPLMIPILRCPSPYA